MPQTTEIPKLVADVTTDHQLVNGPDGKQYRFNKKFTQDQINNYFTKKGIKAPTKETKKEDTTDPQFGVGRGIPPSAALDSLRATGTAIQEYTATGMPTALAFAGSTALGGRVPFLGKYTGVAGAAIGGFVGEDIRQMMMRPILHARGQQDLTAGQSLMKMSKEAGEQALLQYSGEKAGEYFFKMLDKAIPHAKIKGGIPLLPSDLDPQSKLMKYTEDLLTNLSPSGRTMEEFFTKQSAAAETKATKLAKGFSKFSGNSEQIGNLIQQTLKAESDSQWLAVEKFRKQMVKNPSNLAKLNQMLEDYRATFRNSLMKQVISTDKPELIAGMLRNTTKSGLENTRKMMDLLHEKDPKLAAGVGTIILKDIVSETMTGHAAPTIRTIDDRFSGKVLKDRLDKIGEPQLKTILGETKYANLQKFLTLTENIDRTHGNGVGKFVNLMFLLPIRQGISVKGMSKIALTALIANRAAKVITSTEGMKIYENVIKAQAQNLPRLTKLSVDELRTFVERSDREQELEQKQAEEQFKQMHEEKK